MPSVFCRANTFATRLAASLIVVLVSRSTVAFAIPLLVVLPLAPRGVEITAAQVETLSRQLIAAVKKSARAYRTRSPSAATAAAVWKCLGQDLAGVDRGREIDQLLGGHYALLYGRPGE